MAEQGVVVRLGDRQRHLADLTELRQCVVVEAFAAGSNVSAAARRLGLSRAALDYRLKKRRML
ncbi:helix-turn-helix domain-containing protein [Halomonas sp. HK25]|uniref:helix-turn-helix domain-containing protein n=1 Tax=Halomonas sp. HK25 TaxID=3394321 RepID=UPI0039FD4789